MIFSGVVCYPMACWTIGEKRLGWPVWLMNCNGFDIIAAVVEVSITYDQDWKRIELLLTEAATKVDGVVHKPYPYVVLTELGNFAAIYELRAFTDKPNEYLRIQSEIRMTFYDTFQKHESTLQRQVQLRREEGET
jgi:small-conductance mechanosensitive channel